MEEIFKEIPGFEGLYVISNHGVVCNIKTNVTLKGSLNYKGYVRVSLHNGSRHVSRLVHRLVWEAFNGPIPVGLQINHINEIKTDNSLSNLELVTAKQNRQYSVAHASKNRDRKPIAAFDESGNFAMYFDTLAEAGRHFRSRNGNANIEAAIITNGTAYGYKWVYFNDLSPVDKLRVVVLDDIKNKEN